MIQYRITFKDLGGGAPAPECGTSSSLDIDIDDGVPKKDSKTIEVIDVYASSGTTGPFVLDGDDGSVDDKIEDVTMSSNGASAGGCCWSRNAAGNLELEFSFPATNDVSQIWSFAAHTPPLALKVRVKRQSSPNTGDCARWADITV